MCGLGDFHVHCSDICKAAEDTTDVLNTFSLHNIIYLEFQGYIGVGVSLLDMKDFVKVFFKMDYAV